MPRLTVHNSLYLTAALASLGAGILHLAVAPDHYQVWWVSGVFFVVLGITQIGWSAVAAWRPGRPALRTGVVINLGSVLLWAITRTPVGMPLGPHGGTQLPVGPAGILTVALEASVLLLLAGTVFVRPVRHAVGTVLVAASAAGVLALTAPGVDAALSHDHADHADAGSHAESGTGHDDGGHGGEVPHEKAKITPDDGATPTTPGSSPRPQEPKTPKNKADDDHTGDGHGH